MEKILKLYKTRHSITSLNLNEGDEPFPSKEEQIIIAEFEYNANRMGGAPAITAKIMYKECLDDLWGNDVYAEFGGEKYYVMNTPSSNKDNDDTRYEHEIELLSEREVLNHVYFIDAVQQDETIDKVKSNSTKVIFMGDINEFAARLNSSLSYSNLDYTVVIDEGIETDSVLVSFEDKYFYEALQEGYNLYKVPFYFEGKTIHFGYTEDAIPNVFKYGFNNALLSISKQNANYKIVTRCTGYGSSDNIPYYYPNATAKGDVKAIASASNAGLQQSNIRLVNNVLFSEKFNTTDSLKWDWTLDSGCIELVKIQVKDSSGNFADENLKGKNIRGAIFKNEFGQWSSEIAVRITYKILKKSRVSYDYKVSVLGEDRIINSEYSTNKPHSGEFGVQTIVEDVIFGFIKPNTPNEVYQGMSFYYTVELVPKSQETKNWSLNGSKSKAKLENYGLELLNITEDQLVIGDTITQEIGTLIPSTGYLMPPIYRQTGGAEQFYNALNNTYPLPEGGGYYTFENEYDELNPHEMKVSFEDIKPSIVGMTNSLGQRIDKFLNFAWDEDDNDELNEEGNYIHSYFFAKLPKTDGEFGFNLFDHASEQGAMTISMTSGTCGACNFEIGVGEKSGDNIVQVDENGNLLYDKETGRVLWENQTAQPRQNDTQNYEVWIALKKEDSTYGTVLPSKKRNLVPSTDDTFVIININLPQAYIDAAEKKLEDEIIKYISENNVEKFNFEIAFSRIYLAQNPQVLAMLNENARIIIEYNGQQHTLYVESYSYKMSSNESLPEISVTLTDTINVGTNSLRNAISSVTKEIMNGSNGDILAQGTKYFLRKDVEDTAQKTITFEQGLKSNNIESKNFTSGSLGSGHKLFTDPTTGESYCEIDRLYVRMKAYFDTLEIKEVSHIGGELILTPASMKCNRVEVIEPMPFFYVDGTQKVYKDGKLAYTARKYRCYFNADDGDEAIQNQFVVGDLAYCKQFNIESGIYTNVSNRFYWYEVTGVGSNYIEITEGQCAEGSDIPKEGDTIVSLGNKTDAFRQNAIILSTVGINAPSKILYQGINDYSLSGKAIIEEGFDPESNQAYQKIYGKTYIGARDESSYLNFDPVKSEFEVRAKLDVLPDSQGVSVFEDAMDFAQQTNNVMSQYLGYVDWDELVNATLKGKTIIKDGLINTELIFAQTINAQQAIIRNLVLQNAKVQGNIYTPMVVITEDNWREYLGVYYNRSNGYAYIKWDKTGLNIQINYWPNLIEDPFNIVVGNMMGLPLGDSYLGCEVNIAILSPYFKDSQVGFEILKYNTTDGKYYILSGSYFGMGFYKLRLIKAEGLTSGQSNIWLLQSYQTIEDI